MNENGRLVGTKNFGKKIQSNIRLITGLQLGATL